MSASTAAGDATLTGLMAASGMTEALGADAPALAKALVEADHASARTALAHAGLDPSRIRALLGTAARPARSATLAAWPSRTDPVAAAGDDVFGAYTAIAAMLFNGVAAALPVDGKGHLDAELPTITDTTSKGAATVTATITTKVDLWHCPDANGIADGKMHTVVSLSGTIKAAGGDTTFQGSTDMTLSVMAVANADATLAAATFTEDLSVKVGAAGEPILTMTGVGATMTANGQGELDPSTTSGHAGGASGSGEIAVALFSAAIAIGVLANDWHSTKASQDWQSGRCIVLTQDPANPTPGADGSADVTVRARSVRDDADVTGSLRLTPARGTVDPTEGQTALKVHVTVDSAKGDATATALLRSMRGIGKGSVSIAARDFKVDVGYPGSMTLKGTKCGGPSGRWHLVVGGKVTQGGFVATFSGSIDVTLGDKLTGTYTANVKGQTVAVAAGITAKINLSGNGHARLDLDSGQLLLLDGKMSASYLGTSPTIGLSGALAPTDGGASSVPVLRFTCGT